ncbi:MAG TPA: Cys-tRNA(Pro) deacylase [Candidatus Limnocylindrales bacterium]|nr:Cys-tRNA(Pro) deacylase [Candidatus Limnocylindrales bacterium]
MNLKKTNAARLLDGLKIPYELRGFHVDDGLEMSAEVASEKSGFPLERVFKTLVARGDRKGILVCCVSGGSELHLKSLAALSGNKKIEMVPVKEIKTLTGYIKGGVSPLGMKKIYPVYLDEKAFLYSTIMISAGEWGLQIVIDPRNLVRAVNAVSGKITE